MMNLAELENTLPNGFHDGELLGVDIRISESRVVLRMRIDLSTPDKDCVFQRAEVVLDGLQTIVVEGPDRRYPEPGEAANIDGFKPTEEQFPGLPDLPEEVRKNLHSVYLGGNWNSSIHIAAKSARIIWEEGGPSGPEAG